MQQKACKSEILAPKWPSKHNWEHDRAKACKSFDGACFSGQKMGQHVHPTKLLSLLVEEECQSVSSLRARLRRDSLCSRFNSWKLGIYSCSVCMSVLRRHWHDASSAYLFEPNCHDFAWICLMIDLQHRESWSYLQQTFRQPYETQKDDSRCTFLMTFFQPKTKHLEYFILSNATHVDSLNGGHLRRRIGCCPFATSSWPVPFLPRHLACGGVKQNFLSPSLWQEVWKFSTELSRVSNIGPGCAGLHDICMTGVSSALVHFK